MPATAASFRQSAQNCRELAKQARDDLARRELNDIAAELEREAEKIAADEEGEARRI